MNDDNKSYNIQRHEIVLLVFFVQILYLHIAWSSGSSESRLCIGRWKVFWYGCRKHRHRTRPAVLDMHHLWNLWPTRDKMRHCNGFTPHTEKRRSRKCDAWRIVEGSTLTCLAVALIRTAIFTVVEEVALQIGRDAAVIGTGEFGLSARLLPFDHKH